MRKVLTTDEIDQLTLQTMQGKLKGFFRVGNTVYACHPDGHNNVIAKACVERKKKKRTRRGRQ